MSACRFKATNLPVTPDYLARRSQGLALRGYEKPKWILFCETLLAEGFTVYLYEARETVSKYITVAKGRRRFKVRFSNHKPIRHRELAGDCDFFVGHTHLGISHTGHALKAVRDYFGARL